MAQRTRIAVLVFAAIFAAGPSLAIAADCASCCCPPAPCHDASGADAKGDCQGLEAATSCCDLEPAAAPAPVARPFEAPAFYALPRAWPASPAAAPRLSAPTTQGSLQALLAPARLSVVLRN